MYAMWLQEQEQIRLDGFKSVVPTHHPALEISHSDTDLFRFSVKKAPFLNPHTFNDVYAYRTSIY